MTYRVVSCWLKMLVRKVRANITKCGYNDLMSPDNKRNTKTDELKDLNQLTPREFNICIDADGMWFHEGGLISRPAMVKLFASVLHREANGSYWLVTPVERGTITVADAPFIAVALSVTGSGPEQEISFTTNVGDEVILSLEHPLTVRQPPHSLAGNLTIGVAPYILVRDRLEAKLNRPVFYELAKYATSNGQGELGVWSCGNFFLLEV